MKKENLSQAILKSISIVLSVFNLLMYFSMRQCWSGTSKTLGYEKSGSLFILYLPVGICILFLLTLIANIVFAIVVKNGRRWPIVFIIVNAVYLAAITVTIIFGAKDYLRFIKRNMLEAILVLTVVLVLCFFMFVFPNTSLAGCRWLKITVLFAAIIVACIYLCGFRINYISYEPVVYAVEEEYQIVYSGNAPSVAWVTIDGKDYYELYSGSMKSADYTHKICVPMSVLDNAKAYEIHLQQLIYRGPFGGLKGKVISKSYDFKPADSSDGLKYLSFSDIHERVDQTVSTSSYVDNYDFLVINGDTVSMVDGYSDANLCNEICFKITQGSIPVIYARGNHEIKGKYAEDLHKYVGSSHGTFYYNTRLDGTFITVLDIGEDHDDDWWEYYGTSFFESYREEQYKFLEETAKSPEYLNSKYKLVVCHIPIVFVNARHNHEYAKEKLTGILNGMSINMNLCAHQHDIFVFEPDTVPANEKLTYNPSYSSGTYKGYLTDFKFPSLMISKPGFTQTDESVKSQVGLVVEYNESTGLQTCYYLNSNGDKLSVVNPFADIDYGTEIEIPTVGRWK